MRKQRVAAAVALAWCVPAQSGMLGVSGVTWVEVDNSSADAAGDVLAGALWRSEPGWRTFDLYLVGEPGRRVQLANLGGDFPIGLPGLGLRVVGGTVFNHPGASTEGLVETSPVLQGSALFNLTRFDTYAALGAANAGGAAPSEMQVVGMIQGLRNGQSEGPVMGTWNHNPLQFPGEQSVIGPDGMMRLLRVTVSASTTELWGRIEIGLGLPELALVAVDIPDAIPAPGGGGALVVLGCVLAARRRR